MEGNLTQNRSSPRLTPRTPVTVAVQDGETSLAYGVVTNISETGACVMTDTTVGKGRIVMLRMSFYRHADLLETPARIVWSGPEFEDLVSALRQDLSKLGSKLRRDTYRDTD